MSWHWVNWTFSPHEGSDYHRHRSLFHPDGIFWCTLAGPGIYAVQKTDDSHLFFLRMKAKNEEASLYELTMDFMVLDSSIHIIRSASKRGLGW